MASLYHGYILSNQHTRSHFRVPITPVLAGLTLSVPILSSTDHSARAEPSVPDTFASFANDYYAALFAWDPTQATYAGIHDFDDKLANLNANGFARRAELLKKIRND